MHGFDFPFPGLYCCRQVRGSGSLPFTAINVRRKVMLDDRVTELGDKGHVGGCWPWAATTQRWISLLPGQCMRCEKCWFSAFSPNGTRRFGATCAAGFIQKCVSICHTVHLSCLNGPQHLIFHLFFSHPLYSSSCLLASEITWSCCKKEQEKLNHKHGCDSRGANADNNFGSLCCDD